MPPNPTKRPAKRRRPGIDREKIVTAATELFAKKGYRATSLDEIAEKLEVKKPSIYHYIASKEDVLMEIFRTYYDLTEKHLRPISEELTILPNERLRRMMHTYVEIVTEHPNVIGSLVRAETELSRSNQLIVLRKNRELERMFESVVIEGQEIGIIRDVTPRLVALGIIGMIESMMQWYSLAGWPLPAKEIGAEFALLLESGWLSDGSDRATAWPRALSVSDALSDPLHQVEQMRESLNSLESKLKHMGKRLEDGLAINPNALE